MNSIFIELCQVFSRTENVWDDESFIVHLLVYDKMDCINPFYRILPLLFSRQFSRDEKDDDLLGRGLIFLEFLQHDNNFAFLGFNIKLGNDLHEGWANQESD